MATDRRKSELDRQIDDNLRRVYREDVSEDLPPRFNRLLDQLRKSARKAVREKQSEEDGERE